MPDLYRDFIKKFESIARHTHRYDVFRDFVTMSALSLHNALAKDPQVEEEYLSIVGRYSKEDQLLFSHLLGELVKLLEVEPADVLGTVYLELGLGNDNAGQFFTPPAISELMAQMTYGDKIKNMTEPFITVSEPACGAGGMVLAFVRVMLREGMNPAERMWAQCIDVDRLAALMCYVQLSLWHVPAEVLVGNTLSMKMRERYYTPAHYLGNWSSRLKQREMVDKMKSLFTPEASDTEVTDVEVAEQEVTEHAELVIEQAEPDADAPAAEIKPTLDSDQFDFNF